MRELSILTCLMIFLYDAPTTTSCRADEHSQIIDAIAKRDVARAERLMLEHLAHIESSMKLDRTPSKLTWRRSSRSEPRRAATGADVHLWPKVCSDIYKR
jgi:hypothetical protein